MDVAKERVVFIVCLQRLQLPLHEDLDVPQLQQRPLLVHEPHSCASTKHNAIETHLREVEVTLLLQTLEVRIHLPELRLQVLQGLVRLR